MSKSYNTKHQGKFCKHEINILKNISIKITIKYIKSKNYNQRNRMKPYDLLSLQPINLKKKYATMEQLDI